MCDCVFIKFHVLFPFLILHIYYTTKFIFCQQKSKEIFWSARSQHRKKVCERLNKVGEVDREGEGGMRGAIDRRKFVKKFTSAPPNRVEGLIWDRGQNGVLDPILEKILGDMLRENWWPAPGSELKSLYREEV